MKRIEIVPLKDAPIECVLYTTPDREVHLSPRKTIRRTSFMRTAFLAARQTRQAQKGGYAVLVHKGKAIAGWALVAPFAAVTQSVGVGVFVREPHRRQGIGTKLAKVVKEVAEEHYFGARIVIGPSDEAGEKMFRKAGYDTPPASPTASIG